MNHTELVQKFKSQFKWIEKGFYYITITLFIHLSLTGIKHLILMIKNYLVIKDLIKDEFSFLFAISEVSTSIRWMLLSYSIYLILNYLRTQEVRFKTLQLVSKLLVSTMVIEAITKLILYVEEAYTFYFQNNSETILSINPTFHLINFFYFTYPFVMLFVAYFIHLMFKFWSFQLSQNSMLPQIVESSSSPNNLE